jgi:hypothetical protein
MAGLAKPGGRIVFLEPNPLNPLYYVQMLVVPGMSWSGDRGILNMREQQVFGAMAAAGLVEPALKRFGFFPPFLVNRRFGPRLEGALERVRVWRPFLPFQLFRADVPTESGRGTNPTYNEALRQRDRQSSSNVGVSARGHPSAPSADSS